MSNAVRSWSLHKILAAEGAISPLLLLNPDIRVGRLLPLFFVLGAAIGVGWAFLLDYRARKGERYPVVLSAARWSFLLVLLFFGFLMILVLLQHPDYVVRYERLCYALLVMMWLCPVIVPIVAGCLHRSFRVGFLTVVIPIPVVTAFLLTLLCLCLIMPAPESGHGDGGYGEMVEFLLTITAVASFVLLTVTVGAALALCSPAHKKP